MKFSPSQKLNILMLVLASIIISMPSFSFAAPSTLVIDEFRVDGVSGNKDEYAVIANYGTTDVDLDQYAFTIKTSNTTYQYLYRFTAGSLIKTKQKIKICHVSMAADSTCDLFYSISATSTYELKQSGVLALINVAKSKENVDVVGYGDIDYGTTGCWVTGCEKYSLDEPDKNTPYRRINGQDTDNSATDFEAVVTPVIIDLNTDKLVISELLPSPETGEEWFELYNPTNQDISLGNLKICDAMGSRHCFFFDKADLLPANSYKIYVQSVTRITLNNTGDWLELYDLGDNLLTNSGGNYGAADKGISLSLFGSEYHWTKALTPSAQNVFVDTIEIEPDSIPKPKTSKSKVVTAAKKTVVLAATDSATGGDGTAGATETEVRAAKATNPVAAVQKAFIDHKILGWALIGLAILLVVGYTFWYFRDYAKNIYDKIRHRDDSARF